MNDKLISKAVERYVEKLEEENKTLKASIRRKSKNGFYYNKQYDI